MNIVEVRFKSISCSSKTCNYKARGVKFRNYHKWVDKPCPRCGDVLLSKSDYNRSIVFSEMSEHLNNVSGKAYVRHKVTTINI